MPLSKIAPLFQGWQEALIWSCLQGCMGRAVTDDDEHPASAFLEVGDFCFFAGAASTELAQRACAPILVPQNQQWEQAIEAAWGACAQKSLRYAIQKEPRCFDTQRLTQLAKAPDGYELQLFDRKIYEQALSAGWSKDFCALFASFQDYSSRGLGVAALFQGELVAGASSYAVYRGGIEIEIDTKPEFRRKGLATACGARLILECLRKNLYPSWDAHDLRSVALAEKLGYQQDKPYLVYFLTKSKCP